MTFGRGDVVLHIVGHWFRRGRRFLPVRACKLTEVADSDSHLLNSWVAQRKVESVEVVYCVDRRYLPYFATSFFSLLDHLPAGVKTCYLVSPDISEQQITKLIDFARNKHGVTLTLIPASQGLVDDLPVSGHISATTYFRLWLGELLPDECHLVLYLDADVIIVQDFSSELQKCVERLDGTQELMALAAEDPGGGEHLHASGTHTAKYFNAGVIFLDLKRWRSQAVVDTFMYVANKYRSTIRWHDQDIINLALAQRIGELPPELNFFVGSADSGASRAKILHFPGDVKPWSDTWRIYPGWAMRKYHRARRRTRFHKPARRKTLPWLWRRAKHVFPKGFRATILAILKPSN